MKTIRKTDLGGGVSLVAAVEFEVPAADAVGGRKPFGPEHCKPRFYLELDVDHGDTTKRMLVTVESQHAAVLLQMLRAPE